MAKRAKGKRELRGKARLRAEIVEITRAMHKAGVVSDDDLEQTELRMLGRNAFPKMGAR